LQVNLTCRQDDTATCYCGENSAVDSEARMIDGQLAAADQQPWTVRLWFLFRVGTQNWGADRCGGAIVSATAVLTAAHCVAGKNYTGGMYLLAGRVEDFDIKQRPVSTIPTDPRFLRITKAISFPGYHKATNSTDVAVLIMEKKFLFSAAVQPVCLPLPGGEESFRGRDGTVLGWGQHYSYVKAWRRLMDPATMARLPNLTADQMMTAIKIGGTAQQDFLDSFHSIVIRLFPGIDKVLGRNLNMTESQLISVIPAVRTNLGKLFGRAGLPNQEASYAREALEAGLKDLAAGLFYSSGPNRLFQKLQENKGGKLNPAWRLVMSLVIIGEENPLTKGDNTVDLRRGRVRILQDLECAVLIADRPRTEPRKPRRAGISSTSSTHIRGPGSSNYYPYPAIIVF
jgi:hypothetical protein